MYYFVFIFSFVAFCTPLLQAQHSPKEWAPIGAKWSYYDRMHDTLITIESVAETTMHGKKFKELKCENWYDSTLWLMQDSLQIYIGDDISSYPSNFYKWYDLGVPVDSSWIVHEIFGEPAYLKVTTLIHYKYVNWVELVAQDYYYDSPIIDDGDFGSEWGVFGSVIEKIGFIGFLIPSSGIDLVCYEDSELGTYHHKPNVPCWTLVGREKYQESSLSISPNPCFETFTISGIQGLSWLSIYNLQGTLVKQIALESLSKHSIDVADLPKGVYILHIQDLSGNKIYKKLIKE